MKIFGLELYIFVSLALFFESFVIGHKQYVYLKAVQCQHNSKFLANVSCFAKSYSRTISKATIQASVKIPLTIVWVDFKMQYKYGTIYRDVLGIPRKVDWCYWMDRVKEFQKKPIAHELIGILQRVAPEFIKPCPWKEIRLRNITIETEGLLSVWPTGDYKVMIYTLTGTAEDFLNITFIGSFKTPLKETFG